MSDTALDRAMKMLHIPIGKLPPGAHAGAQVLCREMGACMEVHITACAWYAQYIEKLECKDVAYMYHGHAAWERAVDEVIQQDLPGKTKFEVQS